MNEEEKEMSPVDMLIKSKQEQENKEDNYKVYQIVVDNSGDKGFCKSKNEIEATINAFADYGYELDKINITPLDYGGEMSYSGSFADGTNSFFDPNHNMNGNGYVGVCPKLLFINLIFKKVK